MEIGYSMNLVFILPNSLCSKDIAKDAIFYSYNRYINGFAAMLDENQAADLASKQLFMCIQTSQSIGYPLVQKSSRN